MSGKGVEQKDKGNELMNEKDWKGAIEQYTLAIEADSSNHVFYSNRCAAYFRNGDLDKALKDARMCTKLAPKWPKGYARLAHVLVNLEQHDEALKVCEECIREIGENASITALLKEAKSGKLFEKLKGKWHGTVSEQLGGYDQELDFVSPTQVVVKVFDKEAVASMRLDGTQDPPHMDLFLPEQSGDILHIFKIDEKDQLHLCSPSMDNPLQRPSEFAGPAYLLLKRGALQKEIVTKEERAKIEKMSEEEKIIAYITAALEIFPGKRLLPLQTDSPQVQTEIAMLNIAFQTKNYTITERYGNDVEDKVRKYLLGEDKTSNPKINKLVSKLRAKMQEACLMPQDGEDFDAFREQQQEAEKEAARLQEINSARVKEAKNAAKESEKKKELAASILKDDTSSNFAGASLLSGWSTTEVILGVSVLVGCLSIAAYVIQRNNRD